MDDYIIELKYNKNKNKVKKTPLITEKIVSVFENPALLWFTNVNWTISFFESCNNITTNKNKTLMAQCTLIKIIMTIIQP